MSTHSQHLRRWFVLVVVGFLCLTAVTPGTVRADTNLVLGGKAVVVNTNGDRVRLRSSPSYDASVVTMLGEGDVVSVADGPVTADDGSSWYEVVTNDGFDGYLDSTYLQLSDGSAATTDGSGDGATADTGEGVTPTPEVTDNTGQADTGAVAETPDTSGEEGDTGEVTTPVDESQGEDNSAVETPTDQVQDPALEVTPTEEIQNPDAGVTPIVTPADSTQAETPAADSSGETDAQTPDVNPSPTTEIIETPTIDSGIAETSTTAPDTAETPADDTGADTTPTTTTGTEAASPSPEATATPTDTGEAGVTPTAETASEATPTTETSPSPSPTETSQPSPSPSPSEAPASSPSTDNDESVTPDAQPHLMALLAPQKQMTANAVAQGTGTVTGTDGDGLRCRAGAGYDAAIITVLPEGTQVTLTGAAQGDWQPVNCAGQAGFVYSGYLSTNSSSGGGSDTSGSSGGVGGSTSGGAIGGSTVTGNAVVSGTNGDGLRCRAGGGYDAAVIMVLPEGTQVQLRGDAQGDWQPVFCGGQSGFVYSGYLSSGGSSGGDSGGGSNSGGGSGVTGSAVVSGTDGDGLRCRASAGYDGSVIVVLSEGQQVDVRGSAQGEWTPVYCAGQAGWVYSQYISTGGSSGGNNGGGDTGGSSGGNSSFPAGSTATVTGTGGSGVNLRNSGSLSAAVITVVPEGATVTVGSGSTASWIAATYNGSSGFISATYLTPGGSSSGGGDTGGDNSGSSGGLSVGAHAMTTDNLNLRYSASLSAGVAAVAPSGTVVEITSGLSNGFYGVSWDGLNGYMYGDYLQATDAALTPRGGSGEPSGGGDTGGNAGSGSGTATGQEIANYALQYVGYPYVWAAAGPSAFDCSGFTEWVIQHTLGFDITHDMFQQYADGTPVSYGNLQPGDLVFFQNTYEWGLSHVGIYIGNNQFVHAENEDTGVVVSDITSNYYSSHYYGAVRYGS